VFPLLCRIPLWCFVLLPTPLTEVPSALFSLPSGSRCYLSSTDVRCLYPPLTSSLYVSKVLRGKESNCFVSTLTPPCRLRLMLCSRRSLLLHILIFTIIIVIIIIDGTSDRKSLEKWEWPEGSLFGQVVWPAWDSHWSSVLHSHVIFVTQGTENPVQRTSVLTKKLRDFSQYPLANIEVSPEVRPLPPHSIFFPVCSRIPASFSAVRAIASIVTYTHMSHDTHSVLVLGLRARLSVFQNLQSLRCSGAQSNRREWRARVCRSLCARACMHACVRACVRG
jgi:hypothetical protein